MRYAFSSGSKDTRMRLGKGFTLIELLVTLTVLAVITALAAPSLSQFLDQRRLTGAAEAVYSQILFARSESIKQSSPLYFSVATDEDAGTWLTAVAEEPGGTSIYTVESSSFRDRIALVADPEEPVVFGFDPVRGIKLTDDDPPVPFVAETVFALQLDPSRSLQLRVNAIGRVRICTVAGNLRYSQCD
jgi:type IV fimbrial biogenesis protein FimT